MANWLEKRMNKDVRNTMLAMVVGALGLFLALQYDTFFSELFSRFLPETGGLFLRALLVVVLTFVIVFAIIGVKKALDGK